MMICRAWIGQAINLKTRGFQGRTKNETQISFFGGGNQKIGPLLVGMDKDGALVASKKGIRVVVYQNLIGAPNTYLIARRVVRPRLAQPPSGPRRECLGGFAGDGKRRSGQPQSLGCHQVCRSILQPWRGGVDKNPGSWADALPAPNTIASPTPAITPQYCNAENDSPIQ